MRRAHRGGTKEDADLVPDEREKDYPRPDVQLDTAVKAAY
jgi:hypothetical protein